MPGHGQLRGVRRRLRRDVLPLVEERPEEAATAAGLLARLRGGGGGRGPLVTSEWTSWSHDSSHQLANMPFLGGIERLESFLCHFC